MPSGTAFCRSAPAGGYLRHPGGSSGASQKHRTPGRTRKTAATTGGPVSGTGAPVLAADRERLQAADAARLEWEEATAAKAEAAALPAPNSTSAAETAAEAPEVARASSEAEREAQVDAGQGQADARPEVQVEVGAEVYLETLRGTCPVSLFRR